MTVIEVPADPYAAADWLAHRHPWVRQLAERIAGPIDLREDWLDVVTQAVNESDADGVAWVEYERRHPAPADETAFYRWHDDGPQSSAIAHAFGVMSSGEKNLVRLVATLGGRTAWCIGDVSFDQRGAAVLADWLAIVHAQLPAWLYPVGDDSPNCEAPAVSR